MAELYDPYSFQAVMPPVTEGKGDIVQPEEQNVDESIVPFLPGEGSGQTEQVPLNGGNTQQIIQQPVAPIAAPQKLPVDAFSRGGPAPVPAVVKTGQANQDVSLRDDQVRALTGENKPHQAQPSQDAFDLPGEPLQWWNRVHDEAMRKPDGEAAKKLNSLRSLDPALYQQRHQAAVDAFKQQQDKQHQEAQLERDLKQAAIKQVDEQRKEALIQSNKQADEAAKLEHEQNKVKDAQQHDLNKIKLQHQLTQDEKKNAAEEKNKKIEDNYNAFHDTIDEIDKSVRNGDMTDEEGAKATQTAIRDYNAKQGRHLASEMVKKEPGVSHSLISNLIKKYSIDPDSGAPLPPEAVEARVTQHLQTMKLLEEKLKQQSQPQAPMPSRGQLEANNGRTQMQNAQPVRVNSPQEARNLPPGTQFVAPDGTLRIKH